ncbi:hypothetical protein [uncultured Pseudokineococcus sp.]|uniref:hypothetical protein n=1 Tax=uncultured Pseudokineococcus sp. TaxID=1642928 RepID=UPI0026187A7B|nr:hypothetical protein [uncultured Pseudokineococcus sp.]
MPAARRRRLLVADLAVKAVVLGLLALALAVPEWERFSDKAMDARAVVYPVGLLLVPAAWLLVGRPRGAAYPLLADLLVSLPWAVDLLGNALDLFDAVVWFDDAAHLVNWALLAAALALVLPRGLPPGVRVLLVAGCGCLAALVWEVGEYATFVRGGPEEATAYADTLGDMVLGTLGALLAGAVVTRRRTRLPR